MRGFAAILIKITHKLKPISLRLSRLLLSALVVISFGTKSLAQKKLPAFSGTDLNGHKVEFPTDLKGKKSLVGFSFSRKSQEDLESWAQPVYDEFIDKESLASLVYDANVFLVIVFNRANSAFRNRVEAELKEGILKEFYVNVVLCDDESGEIVDRLGVTQEDVPVLYALNGEGYIVFTTTGHYADKKMEELSSYLEIE